MECITILFSNFYLDGAIRWSSDNFSSDKSATPNSASMSGQRRQQTQVGRVPDLAGLVLWRRRQEVAGNVDRVDVLKSNENKLFKGILEDYDTFFQLSKLNHFNHTFEDGKNQGHSYVILKIVLGKNYKNDARKKETFN